MFLNNLQGVAWPDHPTLEHSGENAFFRHGALTYLLVYGATRMAFLAYLGYLQLNAVSCCDPCADRYAEDIHSINRQVLGEIAGTNVQSELAHFLDTAGRKQAYLPMCVGVGMGITVKTHIALEYALFKAGLASPLLLAPAHSYDVALARKHLFHIRY
jgi:hypothetical protein